MTSHTLTQEEARRPRPGHPARRSITQLGWLHYWLIVASLGGLLGLIGIALLIHSQS